MESSQPDAQAEAGSSSDDELAVRDLSHIDPDFESDFAELLSESRCTSQPSATSLCSSIPLLVVPLLHHSQPRLTSVVQRGSSRESLLCQPADAGSS